MIRPILFSAGMAFCFSSIALALSPKEWTPESLADATQEAHNLESWWGKEVIRAEVAIIFGGTTAVDGKFTFEAHGPRARYDRRDGVSIIFDGETAWVSPTDAEAPRGRFHVLTWPWFIMAPFKMQGNGIQLSELGYAEVAGEGYLTLLQTFADGLGDTPDDWYRFFINAESFEIEMMSYIVTYGKNAAEANEKVSIIRYFDYTMPEMGPSISKRYEFWYWDPETKTFEGDGPKATGSVGSIEYLDLSDADFSVPADARELLLPE